MNAIPKNMSSLKAGDIENLWRGAGEIERLLRQGKLRPELAEGMFNYLIDRGENPRTFTLDFGRYKTGEEYLAALEADGHRMKNSAPRLLRGPAFVCDAGETRARFEVISVMDLGLGRCASVANILASLPKINRLPCFFETGPRLRLKYRIGDKPGEQPRGDWIMVVSQPIMASDGEPNFFFVGHGRRGSCLRGLIATMDMFWNFGYQLLVRVPDDVPASEVPW